MISTARRRSKLDKLRVLASVLRDKDYVSIFNVLEETFKDINIFSIDHPRSVSEEHIPERFKGKFVADFLIFWIGLLLRQMKDVLL